MPAVASTGDPVASAELAAFLAAYEAGTVQGAADALTLTQSAVTKRIQSLERRLGAALFERGRLGVTPTELGRTIYPPAKEALAQLQAVALAAEATRAGDHGDLRLSASLTIGEFLLPAWLSAFREREPGVHPQLEVVGSAAVLAAVRERRAVIGFIEGEATPGGLESLVVARDALVVAVAPDHPWARRRSVSIRALTGGAGGPYLTRERDSGTRAVATAALAAHGVTLTPALEVASIQGLKRMIASGGFSILSRLAITDEVRAGTLVGCELRGVDLSRELRAIRLARRRRPSGGATPAGGSSAARFWAWLTTRAHGEMAAGAHAPG
ncbi:MAG TPA: LysR family transcriptional regulator [Solirubrobacteraceae bacterium]|nr:LysR family transcriptional regulator [Solirubrobacteraceae bacterium]